MPLQKIVDGYIPLPREFEPVARVPPIVVEVAIGEPGHLREGTEEVFEDDEEDQEEDDHEGKQEGAYSFAED